MKKRFFDLQLFAEEAATIETTATEQATTEPVTAAETKPVETTATKPEDEKKYSDADIDKILNKKFAEWQTKKEKEVNEAKKLAEMNAQQKAEYERDQLQKELDALKKANSLSEMQKTARKMLADDGINVSDELLSPMVTTDAEQTKAAIDSFKTLFKEAVEKQVKETIRGETPKTGTGSAAPISEIDKRIKKYE
jgi:hypothetical protein